MSHLVAWSPSIISEWIYWLLWSCYINLNYLYFFHLIWKVCYHKKCSQYDNPFTNDHSYTLSVTTRTHANFNIVLPNVCMCVQPAMKVENFHCNIYFSHIMNVIVVLFQHLCVSSSLLHSNRSKSFTLSRAYVCVWACGGHSYTSASACWVVSTA